MQKFTFGVLTLALIASLTFGFSNHQTALAETGHDHGHDEHELLEKSMKTMNSAFKQLRRKARDKSFEASSLTQIEKMQTATLVAMHQSDDDFANDKKRVIQYRGLMANTLKKLLDMELAILEGKNDDAAKIVGEVYRLMKEGHKHFKD